MKAKLSFPTGDSQKVLVAAHWSDVKILKGKIMGAKTAYEVSTNDPNKLVEMGGHIATLTPEQVKAEIASLDAAAKEAAAKATAKAPKK